MKISSKTWQNYIRRLAKINTRAAGDVVSYMVNHDVSTYEGTKALIDYAYAVSTKYGEAAAELSCQMYDAIATASKASVPAAEPAATATYGEIARTIYGTMASSKSPDAVGAAIGRSVKLASVDTLQKNALRDGAEWAWIPSGDSCPFCIMLASNGWQKASKKAIKNGHASHIHNNCDCTYCVRFDHETTVEGYGDGEEYLDIYEKQKGIDPSILKEVVKDGYDLKSPKGRMIAMGRAYRAANKDYINVQKRAAYALRNKAEPAFSNIVKQGNRIFSDNEIDNIAKETLKIADKHVPTVKSRWSGVVEIDDTRAPAKRWSCNIRTPHETSPHAMLHEQLHAKSVSLYGQDKGPLVYRENKIMEEASVQLLCQEISKAENITVIKSKYDADVDLLRDIKKIVFSNDSEYRFAQNLFAQPLTERVEWIRNSAYSLSIEDNIKLNNLLVRFE